MDMLLSHVSTLNRKAVLYCLNKGFVFQKIFLKVKILKTFSIFSDFHIRTGLFFREKAILEIPLGRMVIFKIPSNGF